MTDLLHGGCHTASSKQLVEYIRLSPTVSTRGRIQHYERNRAPSYRLETAAQIAAPSHCTYVRLSQDIIRLYCHLIQPESLYSALRSYHQRSLHYRQPFVPSSPEAVDFTVRFHFLLVLESLFTNRLCTIRYRREFRQSDASCHCDSNVSTVKMSVIITSRYNSSEFQGLMTQLQ